MSRRARLDTEAVVTAAIALADKHGLRSLSLTRVAAELGVRPPSLYVHVDGIGDLVRRVGSRGARELAVEMGHAVEGRSGADALRALAIAYRGYARTHPGAYEAAQLSRELQKDPEAAAAAAAATDVAFAVLRGYGIDGEEAVHAARLIRITLHGFVALEAQQGFAIDVPLQATFDRIVAALDLVFAADPARVGGGRA
jgi:AcrR family transcriptional regulator